MRYTSNMFRAVVSIALALIIAISGGALACFQAECPMQPKTSANATSTGCCHTSKPEPAEHRSSPQTLKVCCIMCAMIAVTDAPGEQEAVVKFAEVNPIIPTGFQVEPRTPPPRWHDCA